LSARNGPSNSCVLVDRIGVDGGTTVDVFGTAANEVLPTWVKAILGLVVIGVDSVFTAAEGHSGNLRLNSKSLGISNENFAVGDYVTSGPATNSSGQAAVAEIIPLDITTGGGETLSIDVAPTGTSTAAVKYEIGFLISNDPSGIPAAWKEAFPNPMPFRGGALSDATQLTTTRTALTAMVIPAYASAIVAYKAAIVKTGAITTAEYGTGYFDLQNDMSLSPLLLPTTFGTPVGTGQSASRVPYIPIYIPLDGKVHTYTPNIVLRNAITTANKVMLALAYR